MKIGSQHEIPDAESASPMNRPLDGPAQIANAFERHAEVLARTLPRVEAGFATWLNLAVSAVRAGNKVMFCGNGGSAADAQHLATELSVRFKADRPAIAGLALATDAAAMTATGNDLGFEQLFARQIEALGRPGDMLIGISTSGNSANIIAGVNAARQRGCHTVALLGCDGGALRDRVDVPIIVPSAETARIQEMHILIGHAFCDSLEHALGYQG